MVLQVMLAVDGQVVLQGIDWVLRLLVRLGTFVALALKPIPFSKIVRNA